MTFAEFLEHWGPFAALLVLVTLTTIAALTVPPWILRTRAAAILSIVERNAARGERLLAGPAKVHSVKSWGLAALTNERYIVWMGAREDIPLADVTGFRDGNSRDPSFVLRAGSGAGTREREVHAPRAELEQFRAALTTLLASRRS